MKIRWIIFDKRLIYLLISIALLGFTNDAAAQSDDFDFTYLNPGVRIGYTFGGGVTLGFEVSYVVFNGALAGASAGIDYTFGRDKNIFRLYLDGELGLILFGFAVGGALLIEQGNPRLAPQTTFFMGGPIPGSGNDDRWTFLVPYYRVTYGGRLYKDIGAFLKYSYPIGKGNFGNRFWD